MLPFMKRPLFYLWIQIGFGSNKVVFLDLTLVSNEVTQSNLVTDFQKPVQVYS